MLDWPEPFAGDLDAELEVLFREVAPEPDSRLPVLDGGDDAS